MSQDFNQNGHQSNDRGRTPRPLAKRRCVSPAKHPHIQRHIIRFKETFQKPSQIYKFLRERWNESPIYLYRNLSYISKYRQQTSNVHRFKKIDTIAKRLAKIKYTSNRNGRLQNGTSHHNNNNTSNTNNNLATNNYGSLKNIQNGIPENNCDTNNHISYNVNRILNRASNRSNICYFNWICNDSDTSQKTRSYGYICPWCDKDMHYLNSLMMHLRCCHSRFNFNLVEEDGQPVIEMTLNSSFDGSYLGFKYPGHDLKRDFKFTSKTPERRVAKTKIFFFRARKRNITMNATVQPKFKVVGNNFSLDDGEADVDVCSGRLYYHTTTCLPIKPNELDLDSEADMDPAWLRERTKLMIDEFTDVNEGEKEILKLWNIHLMQNYQYKGDNMIKKACHDFVEKEGHQILSQNLFKNFTLHLANLFDFGLLGSEDVLECIRRLRKTRRKVKQQASALMPKESRKN